MNHETEQWLRKMLPRWTTFFYDGGPGSVADAIIDGLREPVSLIRIVFELVRAYERAMSEREVE